MCLDVSGCLIPDCLGEEASLQGKTMKPLDRWIKHVNQGLVIFAGSLIVTMAFLASYGSIRRYVFNAPEPVSYELSKMFLLLIVRRKKRA